MKKDMPLVLFFVLCMAPMLFMNSCAHAQTADKYEFKRTAPNGQTWRNPTAATVADAVLATDNTGAPVFIPITNLPSGFPVLGNEVIISNTAPGAIAIKSGARRVLEKNGTAATLGIGDLANTTIVNGYGITLIPGTAGTVKVGTDAAPARISNLASAIAASDAVPLMQLSSSLAAKQDAFAVGAGLALESGTLSATGGGGGGGGFPVQSPFGNSITAPASGEVRINDAAGQYLLRLDNGSVYFNTEYTQSGNVCFDGALGFYVHTGVDQTMKLSSSEIRLTAADYGYELSMNDFQTQLGNINNYLDIREGDNTVTIRAADGIYLHGESLVQLSTGNGAVNLAVNSEGRLIQSDGGEVFAYKSEIGGGGGFPVEGAGVTLSAVGGVLTVSGERMVITGGDTAEVRRGKSTFTPIGTQPASAMRLSGIATPENGTDAANKAYVDATATAGRGIQWSNLVPTSDITDVGYYCCEALTYGIEITAQGDGFIYIVNTDAGNATFPSIAYEDGGFQHGFRLGYGGFVCFAVINGGVHLLQAKDFTGGISN